MKIKQVEELVGITRKNIRFYEEQGLLNVERAPKSYLTAWLVCAIFTLLFITNK